MQPAPAAGRVARPMRYHAAVSAGGTTFWHRCDPRARLLAACLVSGAALAADGAGEVALAAAAAVGMTVAAGFGPRRALAALRPLRLLLVFTFAVHALFGAGPWLVAAGPFTIGAAGTAAGALAAVRLALVILVSAALVATTPPFDLARALSWVFSPLGRVGVPVRDAELVLALGFRFVPQLQEESRQVRAALESRGISARHPRVRLRLRALHVWLAAVLLGMLERSVRLATALEVKGFGLPGRGRRRFEPWGAESTLLALGAAAAAAALLLAR